MKLPTPKTTTHETGITLMKRCISFALTALTVVPLAALADDVKEGEVIKQMQCGTHKVQITCGRVRPGEARDKNDPRVCVRNKLVFRNSSGGVKLVPGYGSNDKNPESMVCGKGRNGESYVQVLIYYCDQPSCGVLGLLSGDGREIAKRSTYGEDNTPEANKYDRFLQKNKIIFQGIL